MTRPKLLLLTMTTLSLLIAFASLRYSLLSITYANPEMYSQLNDRRMMFILHISLAAVALALGAIQFLPNFRRNHKTYHAIAGRVYAISVVGGGISGFTMALGAAGGVSVAVGFGLLSVLWIGFTGNAVRHILQGNRVLHKKWMLRSFALTFAAVTLRVYLVGFMAWGMTYTEASPYLAWICWVPNALVLEWWFRRRAYIKA